MMVEISITYRAERNSNEHSGGWLPIVSDNGKELGSTWASYGYEKEDALLMAHNKAIRVANQYVGDWVVTVEAQSHATHSVCQQ